IVETVQELLQREGLTIESIKAILPPQISAEFRRRLVKALGVPEDRLASVPDGSKDYFTSSLAYSFAQVRAAGQVRSGDAGLVIAVGAGIEVGCVLYYF